MSKQKIYFAAALVAAFCALAPATGTFAINYSVVSGSGGSSSSSSSSSSSDSSSSTSSEETIPTTSAATTTENPNTADETWLLAFASLAVTIAAIGGRYYFVKH